MNSLESIRGHFCCVVKRDIFTIFRFKRRRNIARRAPARPPVQTDNTRINGEIRAREVRVISGTGEQLGIMPVPKALSLAGEANLDLVEVAPNANPPVCRLMDYGKYLYEKQKRERIPAE